MGAKDIVGLLVPFFGEPLGQPSETPLGRAAIFLEGQGVDVVFGQELKDSRLSGCCVRDDTWIPVNERFVSCLHDRFPSHTRAQAYELIQGQRGPLAMGNPSYFTLLCWDKIALQRLMEKNGVPMPEIEVDFNGFERALQRFGQGFLKPQFGAMGRGVQLVEMGDELVSEAVGRLTGVLDPTFLQRAILPPEGWAGVCVRVLLQRRAPFDGGETGSWMIAARILRQSREDPVVNVGRGAESNDGDLHLNQAQREELDAFSLRVASVFEGLPEAQWIVEVGVDLVMDAQWRPHLLEVNSRPGGRMLSLSKANPSAYKARHIQACARPLAYMAWRAKEEA